MEAFEEIDDRQPPGSPKLALLNEKPVGNRYPFRRQRKHSNGGDVLEEQSRPTTPVKASDVEKPPSHSPPSEDASTVGQVKASDVVWLYLTYEIELPRPTCGLTGEAGAPDEPDLSPYTNPLEWSDFRKGYLIWLSCIATAITAYGAGSYAPGVDQMSAYFDVGQVTTLVGITIFTAGFGIAPMILAPFSEINGRRPVFLVTGFLFFIFVLCCALTRSYAGMLISRFLAGSASSTFSTMVGGVVSDIYSAKDRNRPMTLFTAGALFGTGIGPLVSGFIAYHLSWRWIFYVHAIVVFALSAALILFFKETRGTVLLSRKAKALNKWYEAREAAGYYGFDVAMDDEKDEPGSKRSRVIRWKVKADEDRASLAKMITVSLVRPCKMLFTEPVVFFFSLWVSFAWAVLYSTFGVVPYMFETVYGFNLQQANGVFASLSIGAVLATVISLYQERIAARYGKHSSSPEGRLYYACFFSILLPVGLFWFGWTSNASIPWIVPALSVACATMGIFSVYLAVFNYLADCYGPYASSAIAAQSCCRNLLGGAFPLFTQQMYEGLGFGGGGSLMGGIAALLTLVPWILTFYGPRVRARSPFASELMQG